MSYNLTNFTNITSVYDFVIEMNNYYPLVLLFVVPLYVTILFISSQRFRFPSAFLLTNFVVSIMGIPLVVLNIMDIMYEWFLILITAISVIIVWREVRE